ncbi:MAG: FUSC family protein [Peptostreptococcaceae bacterium]
MTFYQAMQLGASNLKPLIKETKDEKLKRKYISAFIIKDFLCLLFCMIIVMAFSSVFGEENSIVGVVTVLCLLTFRFSNLNFNVAQSTITILFIFMIFMVGPYLASISNPIVSSIINFISIMTIVILSCHNVNLSNQSTFVLSYLLLYGYEVSNINVYVSRVIALIIGAIIVAGIFYYKQRKIEFKNKITDIINDINFRDERTKWQVKFTLCICSAILIGELANLPRTMWIGFSCMSILQPNKEKLDFRYKNRIPFLIIGCLIFTGIYAVLPQEFSGYIGLIGGLMVGLSATYQWQTVFNCFGALTSVIPVMGLGTAIIMRILNNVFGALYTKIFDNIFDKIYEKINIKKVVDEIVEG